MTAFTFAETLACWQRRAGRSDLPWQQYHTPYERWLSEVMLQQTQVETVIPYFERFLAAFPSVEALAAASEAQVMKLWAGLGYYSLQPRTKSSPCCANGGEGNAGKIPNDC